MSENVTPLEFPIGSWLSKLRLEHRDANRIASGASALVYNVCWKSASKFAIKKFIGSSSKEAIVNEIYLMEMVNSHPNIIQFHGLTKLQDEKNYSLVLEYAEGGTLRKYLRNDAISFEWESQLRFAKDIASAISWLHDDMGIIHGDLHPNNILINKGTIKIADFGCSYLKGSNRNTQVQAEKADIYSLGVLFWELTSRKMPFDFETKNNDPFEIIKIKSNILKGMREKPSPGTNHKFVALYEKCWQHKPDVRPEIRQVILELNNIEPLVVSENFGFKEIETMEKSGTLENDEVNVPSYDCDINKYNL
ncbi:kinase-like domain-containing protein [Rhizophagus irregularis DAOM 181602=DAOM 197198]|nr:kinase-like domain-containing protein [Rhizophagus irregularis DAOM 181602=DAOM 197198]